MAVRREEYLTSLARGSPSRFLMWSVMVGHKLLGTHFGHCLNSPMRSSAPGYVVSESQLWQSKHVSVSHNERIRHTAVQPSPTHAPHTKHFFEIGRRQNLERERETGREKGKDTDRLGSRLNAESAMQSQEYSNPCCFEPRLTCFRRSSEHCVHAL